MELSQSEVQQSNGLTVIWFKSELNDLDVKRTLISSLLMCDTDDWRWRRRLRHFFNNDAKRDRAEVRPRKDKRGVDLIDS